ncbi:MAG TPA: hypothetical protein VNE41_04300 [Chitinophagaceae bacterium]|nr:hypothetical protein [Chitinophagaceae bacterium]
MSTLDGDETNGDKMTTLLEVLEKLRENNKDHEFTWENGRFKGLNGKTYAPDQLTIIKTFRFEGESNPDDSAILYILETNDGLMGYSLDSYSMYSNHDNEGGYDNFIRQIKIDNRKDQLEFEL